MNNSTDLNQTVDLPATPADSLEAGLAAGFGKRMESPRSTLGNSQRPMLLRDAEGESAHVVKPRSDAMPSAAQVGDRYQLSGEIARGGMGAVLRGRDVDLGRDLAIKVLLEQYADRPEIARRFIEEAQIGGQLQHPGVVPVYDIGHFGDRPFFTMKLVKGQTLAALLSERSDPTVERPRMLSIALQVAQTLAYAHAKGVIHRDLKPANIMVGSFGEVQVMDWGLAKVLAEGGVADEAQASRQYQLREDVTTIRTARSTGSSGSFGTETEAGSLLGTPAYMPPEQANGDVALLDRRADVFGLGAILCEILTGKPPYVGRNSEEVRRKAANGDLADAMARLESCTAEQELISLTKQCLAAEAIDRPKDAQAVADGMTAYLDRVQDRLHQAELAEAAAQVQAKEEIKRRRLTMALAGSIFLLLGVGGGSLWWMDRQAEQRRTEVAIQLANKEAEKKHRQEVTEREVLTALESLHLLINEARKQDDNASKMRLTLLTAKAHAERAEAAVTQGDVSEGVQAKVTAANALLKQANKDHNLLMMLERIRLERGENTSFSSSADAQPVTSTSSAPATKQQSRQLDDSNLRVNSSYRSAFQQYGWDLLKTPAKEIASQIEKHPHKTRILIAIASWTNQADDEDGDRLAHILDAVEEPADSFRGRLRAGLRDQTGKKLVELATKTETLDQPPANIEFLAEQLGARLRKDDAVDLLRKGVDRYPGDFWLHTDLGTRLIGEAKSNPGKLAEASRHLTAALALRPDSPSAAMHLGLVYADLGQDSTAMQWYHRCLAGNPRDPYVHNNIGIVLTRKKQYAEAMPWLQKAVELDPAMGIFSSNLHQFSKHTLSAEGRVDLFRQLAQKHPGSASLQLYYGVACQEANQPTEAEKHYVKALDLSDLYAAYELANQRYSAKDYPLAARFYQLAVKQNPRSIILHVYLAQSYSEQGKYDDAVVVLEKLIERAPQYATPHNYLAALYLDKKKLPEKAIEHAQLAIKLDSHDSWSQNLLGCGLRDSGRTDEAIAQFIKTTSIDKTNVMSYRNLFEIYINRKQFDLAKAAYENLVKIDPADTVQRNEYGRLLRYAGRYDDAVEVLQSIIKTDPSYPPLHLNLGFIFMARKEFAKADEAFKEGMRREPDNARWPYEYGLALRDAGRLDDAAKAFEQALRLNPTDKQSLVELGYICYKQGNFKAAQDYYQQRLQHDQQNNGIKTMLARLKRLVPLEAKLPAVLDGSVPVSDFQIKADLSLWCYLAGRYRKAIQLFTEIEIADRSVVEGLDDWLRYNAACAAILASTGQGIDAKPLDALEARKLRKQTLDWLNTDLALYQKRFESGKTEDRVFIQGRMRHWQQDADFVTVRGKDALSKLQADEREAFSKLWIDVESLLQKVQLRPK